MDYRCELTERPAQPTLAIRVRSPVEDLPEAFGDAYSAIIGYLGELGEQPAGMPYAAYHDMDMRDMDVEIGWPIARELPDRDDIKASKIPAGTYASVMHVGPYDRLHEAHEALAGWVEAQGRRTSGPPYEFYFSEPETPPDETTTQVVIALDAS